MSDLKNFFSDQLISSGPRLSSNADVASIILNRNESPYDIPKLFKEKVISTLLQKQWNAYPKADNSGIELLLATFMDLVPETVVVADGAAALITSLINYFAINKFRVIVPSPSFSLYDYHCKTFGISFEKWALSADLEYSMTLFPGGKEKALVIIGSPNNPTGNVIPHELLEELLLTHPNHVFLVDEVYHEFSDVSYTDLILKHSNLILVRSFSKSFSAAGVRLGYAVCNELMATQLRKLILSFSLNHFTIAFASTILSEPGYKEINRTILSRIISERQKMFQQLQQLSETKHFDINYSHGNFHLLRFRSREGWERCMEAFRSKGIVVLDVSKTPQLENCIRISIGSPESNELVIRVISDL
jgi:histidinol-phosphate aminotransferase